MTTPIETAVQNAEEALRSAMLRSDVDALDHLLAPTLFFTNHLGLIVSKEEDLDAHASGALKIDEIAPSEMRITALCDTVATVSVRVSLAGSYGGEPASGDFRFTRVWALSESGYWQVVTAHATLTQ
ncbi:nuclear transport factor 2 family protein [Desulfoluna spongiiphila]|uniref:nuclear transport factor 2 family protein n=1 Tax=Desulfoluna spongiiphila TaxID=419481 RepID=UPI00125BC74E|nr:nuclear transport factor 2 family protein [Desulfoluna spongiiphila]VVS94232.1 domain of unknown function duf4440 [Desulfoluna spongiiphila]